MRTANEHGPVVVGYGFHGNEERGPAVVEAMQQAPQGVELLNMHPEALREKVRFFYKDMGLYFDTDESFEPGNSLEAKDLKAARRAGAELDRLNPWSIIDLHTSGPEKPDVYMGIGSRTTKETLGIAALLGVATLKVVLLDNYPFFERYPQATQLELAPKPRNPKFLDSGWWENTLQTMADIGPEGMRRIYDNDDPNFRMPNMKYLHKPRSGWVMRVDEKGNPDPAGIRLAERLEQLPEVEGDFTPTPELPDDVAKQLGVQGLKTYTGGWGDRNKSRPMPALGDAPNGQPRRECFGVLYVETTPPELGPDQYLHFPVKS